LLDLPTQESTQPNHQGKGEEQQGVLLCQVSDPAELTKGSVKCYGQYKTESGTVHPRDNHQLLATLNYTS